MSTELRPRICVLGLDCAAPEIVFGDERLKLDENLLALSPQTKTSRVLELVFKAESRAELR